jgi:hypothetical protein
MFVIEFLTAHLTFAVKFIIHPITGKENLWDTYFDKIKF